ncbi:SGNH/GDSL hydrolase family protein [Candidatus Roizmanbacteria bacterium]|nr:SGNH/GDSL hydrolase family protein [Candidatus Roizmanbacteria bacterium]
MARYCYINENSPHYQNGKKYIPTSPYSVIVKIELLVLPIVLLMFTFMFYPMFSNAKSNELAQSPINNQQVLGTITEVVPSSIPTLIPSSTPTPTLSPTPTPIPEPTTIPSKSHVKNSYTIAVYGDSMVDTMGERLEYLEHSLKRLYPSVNFTLYNYGKGSENVEMGLGRWNSRLDYQDRHYPSIVEVRPDIIIMGSFAYNPFYPYERDRHWVGLTKIVEEAKSNGSQIYMLAEIAPLRRNFGKGPNGVNWDENTAYIHSGHIIEQLENAVGLAKTLNIPLIDVFHPSGGNGSYVNPSDGIHPSVAGHEFTANIIANTISLN